jgi:lysophospholipase L1-like esterase
MKISLLFCAVLFFVLTGCGDPSPGMPKLADNATILAFGDSLTHGNGAREGESYPAVLQQLTGRKVINAGISGEESEAGLNRLPATLALHNPQLLILCHGGNDLLRKKDINKMESNIRSMIQLAKDKNIAVVMLGVPKPGLFLSSFEVYKTIAESMDIIFIEDLIPDVLGDNALKSDTVHPNKEGYRVMGESIYAVLKDVGAI